MASNSSLTPWIRPRGFIREVKRLSLSFPNDHPAQIALRTFSLSLSLSLGPALIPLLTSKKSGIDNKRLKGILQRELGVSGFAFAMTVAVGGGAVIDCIWRWIDEQHVDKTHQNDSLVQPTARIKALSRYLGLRSPQRTFLANAISSLVAILLLQSRSPSSQTRKADIPLTAPISPPSSRSKGKTSATLDLTTLFLVRALDSVVQSFCNRSTDPDVHSSKKGKEKEIDFVARDKKRRIKQMLMTTRVDAFVFWAASARIMWCYIYEPERLPHSYVKWITSLANIDLRLLDALRRIREGQWSYTKGYTAHRALLTGLAKDLGYPSSWGDPLVLPATGGSTADRIWTKMNVKGRRGVGGVPCNIVHGDVGKAFGGVGASCTGNAAIRGLMGFLQAFVIYAPVHFLPVILTHPQALLSLSVLRRTTLSILRSSLFLSGFISSIWYGICSTRTLVLARLFPNISHDVFDGPYGCILVGCLACGSSIWIENGKRRGEMALYVLPRAIRASLSSAWLRSGSASVKVVERLTFVLSLAALLSASVHHPENLRGLSRWTLAFIMKGSITAFWKRKGQIKDIPSISRSSA